ncbi:hypothetical protein STSP2_01146 [Anaerohalosphaera lusitana]|uniref:Uncharacterized protein n=1 Tax=Anaerohalosphaera lusitana TaxID=1936003 RepID=A0A1U9NJ79_9BACT|nr:hypothetical protein [Anaerohalosphaera lusitana]AQT67992.1 hypothetical protein STSP2_01146 [Anaerohalosphaera lusitana]
MKIDQSKILTHSTSHHMAASALRTSKTDHKTLRGSAFMNMSLGMGMGSTGTKGARMLL